MQRKQAFLTAGVLTAALTTAFLTFSGFAPSETPGRLQEGDANAAAVVVAGEGALQIQDASGAQSAALQVQLAQSRQALLDLDAAAQPQMAELQAQLDSMEATALHRTQTIAALEAQIAQAQARINQDADAYAQELARLEATELQLRRQIDETVAQLQTAYAEIAARQPSSASMAAGDQNHNEEHEEHEEHEDDDED